MTICTKGEHLDVIFTSRNCLHEEKDKSLFCRT